jgi:RNA polymerase sigma-70 factor (ECF subfamily)
VAASPSDHDLLDAWRSGDQGAGSELFDRHFDALARFFANKVSEGLDDLVQQTFLAAVEARDRYRGDGPFRNFLLRIGHHILCKHYRRGRVRKEAPDFSVTAVADLEPSPSALVAQRGEQRLLLQALRRIPLDLQVVLELAFWEHFTAKEIGEIVEIPLGTAKTRIRRAKELVRTQIEELAGSPTELESTLGDLDDWARAMRAVVDEKDSPGSDG